MLGAAMEQFNDLKFKAEELAGIKHEKKQTFADEEDLQEEEDEASKLAKQNPKCEWYEEPLDMKTIRFAGFF
jgi:hypothetical protein